MYTSVGVLSEYKDGLDVKDILTKMIDPDTNTITFKQGQRFNDVFGKDPAPFHPKILKVKYTVGGVPYEESILEVVTKPRVIGKIAAKIEVAEPPKPPEIKLRVNKAVYGAGSEGHECDVTEFVKSMIDEETDCITFPKTMKFNECFGGDPAMFQTKTLSVDYTLNGVDRNVKIPELRKEDVLITDECGERRFQ
ncbi:hypothetical protein CYMTET_42224 [Cymbomonas tetramitiformis]|uniref:Uncharacterized protein n=1 Tax=Cymbomonas tetramitiformis TaxID=36881 RepID=A0AAE0C4J5_9CHLO|nr:hypothetical protein CYMTET_42224 [Cymbomonas tetramitiformis]